MVLETQPVSSHVVHVTCRPLWEGAGPGTEAASVYCSFAPNLYIGAHSRSVKTEEERRCLTKVVPSFGGWEACARAAGLVPLDLSGRFLEEIRFSVILVAPVQGSAATH